MSWYIESHVKEVHCAGNVYEPSLCAVTPSNRTRAKKEGEGTLCKLTNREGL